MALADTLADLYPTEADLRRKLDEAGIDPARITLNSSAVNDWTAALLEAERAGKWPALLVAALRDYPEHTGLWRAIRERLEERAMGAPDMEQTESEMAPDSPRAAGYFVTERDHNADIRRVENGQDEMERRIMAIVNANNEARREEIRVIRHKWNEDMGPYLLKIEVLTQLADRKLIAQAVLTGLTIVGVVSLILFLTGGHINVGG